MDLLWDRNDLNDQHNRCYHRESVHLYRHLVLKANWGIFRKFESKEQEQRQGKMLKVSFRGDDDAAYPLLRVF